MYVRMGTRSKFQTRVIGGIPRGSIEYSFKTNLFLEINAAAAGIVLMMNSNITNQTCNAHSQSKQSELSEYSLFIFSNVQNKFSLQK